MPKYTTFPLHENEEQTGDPSKQSDELKEGESLLKVEPQ